MSPDRAGNLLHFMNMLESCAKMRAYAAGFTDAESFFLAEDQLHYNACLALIVNVGESAGKVSSDIPETYPEVEWADVRSMRNRVAHDYPGLDIVIVFDIVKKRIPELENSLYVVVGREKSAKIFDPDEWEAARSSLFYRHVDFSRWPE